MSTLKRSIVRSHRSANSRAWATQALLLLINFVVFLVCVFSSPWADSVIAGIIILVLSALPLVALGYWTIRIYRYSNQLRKELEIELEEAEPERLTARAKRLRGEMLQARGQTSALLLDNSLNEFSVHDAQPIMRTSSAATLITAMEGYVMQRYVAREDLRLDALRNFLNEYALDRVQRLQEDHETAFRIGLAGTVLGLGVQIFLTQLLTQTSILGQTFLTGVVLKAGSTFVGILVAWYARSMRSQLLEQYVHLVEKLEAFASYRLSPLFADVPGEGGDVTEALRDIIESLNITVGGIEVNLKHALSEAVTSASYALGERLKETFATELADSIKAQITEPFRIEVERLKNAITRAGDGIADGVSALKDGTREYKEELANMVKTSFTISDQLQDASHVLKSMTQEFEEVVEQADQVAQTLKEFQGEAAIAIERSRSHDGNDNNHWVRGEMEKMMQFMQGDRKDFNRTIDQLTQAIDGFSDRRPRNK